MACPTGASPSTRTFLGAPPTPRFGVSEGKSQTPDAENAPRERDWLFEIVSCERRDARPHPEERARRRRSANFERACARLEGLILRSAHVEDVRQTSNARARVSKDEEGCALMLRDGGHSASKTRVRALGRLLSMRASVVGGILASQPAARACTKPTCGCGRRSSAPVHCFRPVIYNEWCNSNV